MPAMAKARPRHASVSLAEAPLSPEPSIEHPDEDPEMALVACYLPVLRQAGPSAQDRVGGLKCRDIGRSGRWGWCVQVAARGGDRGGPERLLDEVDGRNPIQAVAAWAWRSQWAEASVSGLLGSSGVRHNCGRRGLRGGRNRCAGRSARGRGNKKSRLFAILGETAHDSYADPGCRNNRKA